MSDIEKFARIISHESNSSVVQLPGRKNLGIVIQADSLNNLINLINEASEKVHEMDNEGFEIIEEVSQILSGYLAAYNDAVASLDGPVL